MSDKNSWLKMRRAAVRIAVVAAGAAFLFPGCGKEQGPRDPDPGVTETGEDTEMKTERLSLLEFCDDEELNAWFDSLEENPPVKMSYILMGEAPVLMEFTDTGLILETAQALKTVEIGGVSQETPENVADAGGSAVYFEMADGDSKGFSFVLGCFKWKDGEYHDVVSYGDLFEVQEKLSKIGNPQLIYVYSGDGGFYTEHLETYSTQWKEEDGLGGGLYIYTEQEGAVPYVQICRCADTDQSAGAFLEGALAQYVTGEIEESGATILEAGKAESMSAGGMELPGIFYAAQLPQEAGGGRVEYLNLILQDEDSLLREPHFIRFCAVYNSEDTEQKEAVMKALDTAIRNFNLKYMANEKKEVQPGNLLVDFINDDRLREWFDGLEDHSPDFFLFIADKTKDTDDPEEIGDVLAALQTVKIGDVSNKHVGASGRRIYEFTYSETGDRQEFEFFEDTFYWDGVSYEVLDWGELKKTVFW